MLRGVCARVTPDLLELSWKQASLPLLLLLSLFHSLPSSLGIQLSIEEHRIEKQKMQVDGGRAGYQPHRVNEK